MLKQDVDKLQNELAQLKAQIAELGENWDDVVDAMTGCGVVEDWLIKHKYIPDDEEWLDER